MPEDNNMNLSIKQLSQQDLLSLHLICGTSGALVRWVVSIFAVVFGGLIYFLVLSKPEVSDVVKFICVSMFIIALGSLLLNGRMSRGWPGLLRDNEYFYITYDPIKDEFLRVPCALVIGAKKKMLFPNTMAISVLLNTRVMTDADIELLKTAIYPADDAVHVHSGFNSRDRVISEINTWVNKDLS